MEIWGNTADMETEIIAREDQDDFDLENEIDAPFALTIMSSNGGVVIEGTADELRRYVRRLWAGVKTL